LEATDIISANIANFSAGDVINIDDAYLGADNSELSPRLCRGE
jgi:hypothetical protein